MTRERLWKILIYGAIVALIVKIALLWIWLS